MKGYSRKEALGWKLEDEEAHRKTMIQLHIQQIEARLEEIKKLL